MIDLRRALADYLALRRSLGFKLQWADQRLSDFLDHLERAGSPVITLPLALSWAKDPKIGYKMINARGETVEQKPSFRNAFRRRRCLILADGFYEWSKETGSKSKQPIFIKMQDEKPFAFAGLWEFWQSPDGSDIRSCTIITTEPNELVKQYHNRMPVILTEFDYDLWLQTGETDQEQLKNLLKPYNPEKMEAYAVSKVVNNPANDTRECILPL